MTDLVVIDTLPQPLGWVLPPVEWRYDGEALQVTVGPRCDLFIDPQTGAATLNAPRLLGPTGDGDFVLAARVRVGFAATYDAGALVVWAQDGHWAKLCFEFSPQHEPMVVSVVTRDRSDDANAFVLAGADTVWLRIARLAPAYAFHASTDGSHWQFVRHFTLGQAAGGRIGFVAQSPTGAGCPTWFDQISYRSERLAQLRDGS